MRDTINMQAYQSRGRDYVYMWADHRRTMLNLTASGDQLLNEPIPPTERIDKQLLEALPDAERSLAVGILRKIAHLDNGVTGSDAGSAS